MFRTTEMQLTPTFDIFQKALFYTLASSRNSVLKVWQKFGTFQLQYGSIYKGFTFFY